MRGASDGAPVAVRMDEEYWFINGDSVAAPRVAEGAAVDVKDTGILIPPKGDPACHHPRPTKFAIQNHITGLVLVEYVVHATGAPVPVKVLQAFTFKAG